MDDNTLFRGYEQRKSIGKMIGERKYSASACKDVEKKLSCLSKRINDLENQKRCAYKNVFKIKKKIHNQTNQIVKCFRERERNLLCDVDDAYMTQDSTIGEELSKLISTHSCCQTLYANIDDFRENRDVLSKIQNNLSTINFSEKFLLKPLEFTSNFEQAKLAASNYGCLEGEFVGQNLQAQVNEENSPPATYCIQDKVKDDSHNFCVANNLQTTAEISNMCTKVPKRERTDSQDSFEIVDMLENIHCEDDKDFIMNEKDCSPTHLVDSSAKSIKEITNSSEKPDKASTCAKYPKIEKQLVELQERLKGLATSTSKWSSSQGKLRNTLCPVNKIQSQKGETCRKVLNVANESWLQKNTSSVATMEIDKKIQNYSPVIKISGSPADLIKKAFTPYFASESVQSWLSKQ